MTLPDGTHHLISKSEIKNHSSKYMHWYFNPDEEINSISHNILEEYHCKHRDYKIDAYILKMGGVNTLRVFIRLNKEKRYVKKYMEMPWFEEIRKYPVDIGKFQFYIEDTRWKIDFLYPDKGGLA